MIEMSDIQEKDFSMSLPRLLDKFYTIKLLIEHNQDPYIPDAMFRGLGYIMEEIYNDLKTITEALYGPVSTLDKYAVRGRERDDS